MWRGGAEECCRLRRRENGNFMLLDKLPSTIVDVENELFSAIFSCERCNVRLGSGCIDALGVVLHVEMCNCLFVCVFVCIIHLGLIPCWTRDRQSPPSPKKLGAT